MLAYLHISIFPFSHKLVFAYYFLGYSYSCILAKLFTGILARVSHSLFSEGGNGPPLRGGGLNGGIRSGRGGECRVKHHNNRIE